MDHPQLAAWREQFPVTRQLAYLNHASVSPLSRPAREAMEQLLRDASDFGAFHWDAWATHHQQTRVAAARLIGASPCEIALLKNTSEGLATVASGINWRSGERVVTIDSEFPANLYPWLALRERGVVVDLVPERNGCVEVDELRSHCRGARLLAISFVQFLSGFRIDLDAVGEICREAGCLFVLDAIQGLGAFPVDVKRSHIHVLAADGHKWITGPEGCALFYVDRDVLNEISPHEIGWMSVERWADFPAATKAARSNEQIVLRRDASRFECGTLNTVGSFGLTAALEFMMSIGTETVALRVTALRRHLARGLAELGCEILGGTAEDQSAHRGGILSFRKPGAEVTALVRQLADEKICCAARNGWVRCSPHFYNSDAELDHLLSVVQAA
jgi:selenocysteine lyase/cysteine desulfurase